MLIALDENNERIIASRAKKRQRYYCQGCGELLSLKSGEIRRPHFAHKNGSACEYTANKTEWHFEWQECFGLENAEKSFSLSRHKHVADIQIGDTVIEFQHSSIDCSEILARNEFYFAWGLKTIWVFDVRDDFDCDRLRCYRRNGNRQNWRFEWRRPNSAVLAALDNGYAVFLQATDDWLIEITWCPTFCYYSAGYKNGFRHEAGEIGRSIKKFSGTIMKKDFFVRSVKSRIDMDYVPRIEEETESTEFILDKIEEGYTVDQACDLWNERCK